MIHSDTFEGYQRPVLNVKYAPRGFRAHLQSEEWSPDWTQFLVGRSVFRQEPLPTEIVIREAGFQVPNYKRVYYNTFLYFYDDCIMTGPEIVRSVQGKVNEIFRAMSDYPEVNIHEIFVDCGDDGHTDYQFVGWKFVLPKKE